jgi:hypothetical protein
MPDGESLSGPFSSSLPGTVKAQKRLSDMKGYKVPLMHFDQVALLFNREQDLLLASWDIPHKRRRLYVNMLSSKIIHLTVS